MADHKSAEKAHRQNLIRRTRNRWHRARLRTAIKRLRQAIAAGDKDTVSTLLPQTSSLLDRTAKLGAIHVNVASRTKSRLSRAGNRIAAAS